MQNKGAIRLFAVLMGLACLFYLSFSIITRNIEKDAKQAASNYVSRADVQDTIKKMANGDARKEKEMMDSVFISRENRYLDSMRKISVFDIFINKYTYEDCKENEINLGLDLRGGINVTLELPVSDIIRALSNKPQDDKLNLALKNAQEKEKTDNRDFTTIFGEEIKKVDAEHPIAYYFRSIDLKGKIDIKTPDEEVLKFIRETVDQSIKTAEQTINARINKFGVAQPNIQRLESSGRILVELPGISDKNRVRKLLQGTANLEFWETYESAEILNYFGEANKKLVQIIKREKGLDTTTVVTDSLQSDSSKTVSADTAKNKNAVTTNDSGKKTDSSLLTSTDSNSGEIMTKEDSVAKMREENPIFTVFIPNIDQQKGTPYPGPIVGYAPSSDTATLNKYLAYPEVKKTFPANLKLMWANKPFDDGGYFLYLYAIKVTEKDGGAKLSGDIISYAGTSTDRSNGGNYSVEMTMKDEAAAKWAVITRDNAPQGGKPGRCIAIVLDNLVYSAPTVQGEIPGGRSNITGSFSAREASDLANILSAGKLPVPPRIIEEQVVGPTLGAENIRDGFLSFAIALVIVLLFMAFYYNKAGVVADVVLFVNMFFILGVLASIGAVLTLPGIAGIVLIIALSVDANILIFERIREELREGKGVQLAVREGFANALSSILDSNITTLLLGIILFAYGTGPVQGFATTLIIGILSSLFCALLISRLMFERLLDKKKDIQFSIPATENILRKANINFVGNRFKYYIFSSAIILAGVVFYFKNGGFNLGVDFQGGRSYVVRFDAAVSTDALASSLEKEFDGVRPEVKTYGNNNSVKITTTYLIDEQGKETDEKVEQKLEQVLTGTGVGHKIDQSNKVGSTISRDSRNSSFLTVLFSCLVMFVYILIRFKKWQYGLGATVALFHDVLIILSCYTIFDGILPFTLEIDQHFIAAILTVMGYSMTDTVVVFDRIREFLTTSNKKDLQGDEKKQMINYALNATLSRTILTSLTTFFVLLSIFIFGGEVIRGFAFALLIGIVIGTYSSLCIATPVVIDFDKNENK